MQSASSSAGVPGTLSSHTNLRMDLDKAIAMANRTCCNVQKVKKRSASGAYEVREERPTLEKKIEESILTAKREHMSKMYVSYLDTYQQKRPGLAGEITRIYHKEMENIKNSLTLQRTAPVSPKRAQHRRSESIEHQPRSGSDSPVTLTQSLRQAGREADEKRRSHFDEQFKEIVEQSRHMKEELAQRLAAKIEEAKAKRESLIEGRVKRIHINHVPNSFPT